MIKTIVYLFLLIAATDHCYSQSIHNADSTKKYKSVIAGKQYTKGSTYRFFWGDNYRKIWSTPLTVPVLWLDTAKGGLQPIKEGGGHQSKSLRLQDKNGEEYALRSINKTLNAVVPKSFKGTFIEKQVNDGVSMSNPYGALIVPLLAEAAHVYHTNPVLVYLPKQPLLDTFNDKYGDDLYLLEQKPEGDWSSADNLGNFSVFFATDDVLKKVLDSSNYKVDQSAFIRARIFDWFIGDWDRHEKQWDWGEKKAGNKILFVPVPEDRDQAFSKHDGLLLSAALSAAGLSYMQSFDDNIKSIQKFNYEERYLDRFFTNEMTLQNWQTAATVLQQSLTDDVIDKAVKQLPPAVFNISGKEIIETLKARRTHLVDWATDYYKFISKEVQVTGSKNNDLFTAQRSGNTTIHVFNDHQTNDTAYARTFNSTETKEVRLFGIDGNDVYIINGNKNNIKLRTVGGTQPDSFINESSSKVYVYDDKNGNFINKNQSTKLKLSNDTSVHDFNYDWFRYNKSGIKPIVFYNYYDRIYAGLNYGRTVYKWRKDPYYYKQLFELHYSFSEHAFSFTHTVFAPKLVFGADFTLLASYDLIRWIRFWGLGNDTKFDPDKLQYFTARSRQWIIQPGLSKQIGASTVYFSPFIQGIQVFKDTGRFISKTFITDPHVYKWQTFSGAELDYRFIKLNDSIVPTKGFIFSADLLGAQNIHESNSNYFKVAGSMQVYVPLFSKFSYVLRTGAATVTGNPEFYQYNSIGGAPNLRGFKRDRFWGKTTFWNMHDLRFIAPVKSYFYNGKAGIIAFFDNGRVWMPGETSNTWHIDGGAGITLAPFNEILVDLTYGFSSDGHVIQVRVNKYFGGAGGIRTRVQTSLP